MKTIVRTILSLSLVAALLGGPVTSAAADATVGDAEVVRVEQRPCPPGQIGTVLDFYVGNPPQHVFTLTLCRGI